MQGYIEDCDQRFLNLTHVSDLYLRNSKVVPANWSMDYYGIPWKEIDTYEFVDD